MKAIVVALASLVLVLPGTANADLQTGLVGYWGFNENGGTVAHDGSANGNDGLLVGGATWSGDGEMGGSIALDGTSGYVQIGAPNGIPVGSSPRTFAAWVNWSGTETGHFQSIVSYGSPFTDSSVFGLERGASNHPGHLYFLGWNDELAGNMMGLFSSCS
jgi:hypothetical protein